jgi:hypothetical protein
MEGQAMFLDCPADLGNDRAALCGLPAEVEMRYTVRSTAGPLESAKIRCPRGHWFNGPIESLTVPEHRAAAPVSANPLIPSWMTIQHPDTDFSVADASMASEPALATGTEPRRALSTD